jgi:alkylated DNA repair protein alkB homolog 6
MAERNSVTQNKSPGLITPLPPSCHYLPNFITVAEESLILSQINSTPLSRWTKLSHRRLLSIPGPLTGTKRDTLIAAPLPAYLVETILSRFASLEIFSESPHHAPNHVLINEYTPGQGIMPHEDGPAYFPVTATVSLGSAIVLDIYEKNGQGEREITAKWRILQEPRSLLVTSGNMYRDTLHGIAEVQSDEELNSESIANWSLLGSTETFANGISERKARTSLTYRDVIKVASVGGAVKFLQGKR